MSTRFSPDSEVSVTCTVNGATVTFTAMADTPLLHILRNDLCLNGPKYGCGLGECGACTVIVDGKAGRSCLLPWAGMDGRKITTLEGLGTVEKLHPVQKAFIDAQAAQCGYCLNGMIMTAKALIDRNPNPTEEEIRRGMSANLCRCGTHFEILEAVRLAVKLCQECPSREQ
ncbi:(2Fe-2S)-binding protein (plasmid) [Pseudomonas sp. BYT-5]|uniref:(2Fe-2S)-binding protein n=1 Tax=Pseudomonas sp. BYT-5 TaxID=2944392 RepID=UPI00202182E3|nr:(2Fe-2S)-binding protein [Pseudomonas sp. BYT-5]URD45383.1 (2Fe-2S)-binding protein [Pseudomonas sp. BYT-5]